MLNGRDGMVWIEGGSFRMGSERHYAEEAPVREACVDGFWMDRNTVSNRDFAAFVSATGYITVAERVVSADDYPGAKPELLVPGSLVFHMTEGPVDTTNMSNWWSYVPGACWHRPTGSGSDLEGRADHPVVHVAFEDVAAYAAWADKEIPSEAEWEFAARGGLDGAEFVWGDELTPGGRHMANTWQGPFPWRNFVADGHEGTSPVGSYPPNGYGLFDMAGNVWQWTTDWFNRRGNSRAPEECCTSGGPRDAAMEASYDPLMPTIRIPRKVVKGGSFLCAPNYCRRYRPAARHAQMIDSGMSHIGFRCIVRGKPG